jgi:hypothetical protein
VEIARALATNPSFLLLDEPFTGIDPKTVTDLQGIIRHLKEKGIGVLITDHNVRETLGLTDRAYIIYSGEVLMEGRAEDIVNNPEVRRLYLGEEFRLWPVRPAPTPFSLNLRDFPPAPSRLFLYAQIVPRAKSLGNDPLEFRQSQALVMTPQLMQAIKLLQLSNLDLLAYVDEELEKNPLLERAAEDDGPGMPAEVNGEGGAAQDGEGPSEWMGEGDTLATSRNAIEDELGTRLDNVFPEDGGSAVASARNEDATAQHSEWASVGTGGREDGDYNLEAFVSAERTPADHLAEQLRRHGRSGARMIGQHLIDMVDEAATLGDLPASRRQARAPVRDRGRVRSFRPSIRRRRARNLTECLPSSSRARPLRSGHGGLLAPRLARKARFRRAAQICGVSDEDLLDMVAEIKRLNPKPGLASAHHRAADRSDVFVRRRPTAHSVD